MEWSYHPKSGTILFDQRKNRYIQYTHFLGPLKGLTKASNAENREFTSCVPTREGFEKSVEELKNTPEGVPADLEEIMNKIGFSDKGMIIDCSRKYTFKDALSGLYSFGSYFLKRKILRIPFPESTLVGSELTKGKTVSYEIEKNDVIELNEPILAKEILCQEHYKNILVPPRSIFGDLYVTGKIIRR